MDERNVIKNKLNREDWDDYLSTINPYFKHQKNVLLNKVHKFKKIVISKKEPDEPFNWILDEDKKVLTDKITAEHPSLKYGVPAIPTGDPLSADLIVGLINPSVPSSPENLKVTNSFTKKDRSDEVAMSSGSIAHYLKLDATEKVDGYDEVGAGKTYTSESNDFDNALLNLEENLSKLEPGDVFFNPENTIQHEFKIAFTTTHNTKSDGEYINFAHFMSDSLIRIPSKEYEHMSVPAGSLSENKMKKLRAEFRDRKKQEIKDEYDHEKVDHNKMYYVSRYFGPALVPTVARLLKGKGFNKSQSISNLRFDYLTKDKKTVNQLDLLKQALGDQEFADLKICNLELFPYRSRNIPDIKIQDQSTSQSSEASKDQVTALKNLITAQYSAALIVNRIIQYVNDESSRRPAFILRSYKKYWRPTIETVLQNAYKENKLPSELSIKYVDQFVWLFSSDQSCAISDNNVMLMTVWDKVSNGGKETDSNRKQLHDLAKKNSKNKFDEIIQPVFEI